jgi:hypothetical protein
MYQLIHEKVKNKYMVVHNVEGLKPEYFESEYCKAWPEFYPDLSEDEAGEVFFKRGEQERFCAKALADQSQGIGIDNGLGGGFYLRVDVVKPRPVLIIIDEARRWLERPSREVKDWLAWHRHLGQDVWILAQGKDQLHRSINALVEYEIKAFRGHLVGIFLYRWRQGGTWFKTERLKTDKEIFKTYKSFQQGSVQKKSSKLLHAFVACCVLSVCMFGYAFAHSGSAFGGGKKKVEVKGKGVVEASSGTVKKESVVANPFQGAAAVKAVDSETVGLKQRARKYSLSSYLGGEATFQDEKGRLCDLEDVIPGGRVLSYDPASHSVSVLAGGKIITVGHRAGLVQVDAREGINKLTPGAGEHAPEAGAELAPGGADRVSSRVVR